jgi:(1->4)-alpha-D-glucan 1-alpha-D-glucosylmutase
VDPDNRRAVDYAARRQALERLQALPGAADSSPRLRALLGAAVDGRAKMWTLWRALQMRRERTDLLTHGDYVPLAVTGDRAASVVAYARHLGDQWMVLVAGRLYASLGLAAGALPVGDAWGDTAVDLSCLPRTGRLEDVLSGVSFTVDPRQPLPLAALLAQFPVAILCGTPANGG